jgi:hypothetical protein
MDIHVLVVFDGPCWQIDDLSPAWGTHPMKNISTWPIYVFTVICLPSLLTTSPVNVTDFPVFAFVAANTVVTTARPIKTANTTNKALFIAVYLLSFDVGAQMNAFYDTDCGIQMPGYTNVFHAVSMLSHFVN